MKFRILTIASLLFITSCSTSTRSFNFTSDYPKVIAVEIKGVTPSGVIGKLGKGGRKGTTWMGPIEIREEIIVVWTESGAVTSRSKTFSREELNLREKENREIHLNFHFLNSGDLEVKNSSH